VHNKYFIYCIAAIALLLISIDSLFAGNENRKGTAGAQELLLPGGARGLALGGAMLADIQGAEAIFWNPAGMATSEKSSELLVSRFDYIAGISLNAIAFTKNFRDYGVVGISLKSVSIGDIKETTDDKPDGTGNTFAPAFQTWSLSYARSFTDRIVVGCNAKYIREQILNEIANGIAFDLGLQYESGFPGLRIGFAIQNIGPLMQFTGSDLSCGTSQGSAIDPVNVVLAEFELPTSIELAIAYDLFEFDNSPTNVYLRFQSNVYDNDELDAGLEYSYNHQLFLRGGFRYNIEANTDAYGNERFLFGPSFGGGINIETSYGVSLQCDYAYRTMRYFDGNQLLTVKILW
jgi:hypothetical protein